MRHHAPQTAGRLTRVALLIAAVLLLVVGAAHAAVLGLPSDGSQVNDDPPAGIDPNGRSPTSCS
jgi:hypothetical protein